MSRRIITLTSDFGTVDSYVAAMKGVILSISPEVHLVDLSHDLAVHDVTGAAMFLADVCKFFPDNTIHLAVVDPGVGTARRAICVRTARNCYVAPDNGIVSLAIEAEAPYESVQLSNTDYHRTVQSSATFHGRDIFASVAAYLSTGTDFRAFGPPADRLVRIELPPVNRPAPDVIEGRVVHIDRFGNLVTNVARQELAGSRRESGENIVIQIGAVSIRGLSRTYGDHDPGDLLALWGSGDFLEISVNRGSAAEQLNATVGTPVRLVRRSSSG